MAKVLYTPKTEDIPTPAQINKMTLDELNANITKLGSRINTRMYRLEKKFNQGEFDGTLLALKRLAGAYNPRHDPAGMAQRFNIKNAPSVNVARGRLAGIVKALNYKTSTVSGANAELQARIKRMSEIIYGKGGPLLTKKEFDKITKVLERTRDFKGLDSNQVLDIMETELKEHKFRTTDDLIKFLEVCSEGELIPKQEYDDVEEGHRYKRNPIDGIFYESEQVQVREKKTEKQFDLSKGRIVNKTVQKGKSKIVINKDSPLKFKN